MMVESKWLVGAEYHSGERQRRLTLERLGLTAASSEERFDRLTRLTAMVLDAPIVMFSVQGPDAPFAKSSYGVEALETPLISSLCAKALTGDEIVVVEDTTIDVTTGAADSQRIVGEHGIRFYAGRPISAPDGVRVGTLCVLDRRSRVLSPEQSRSLDDMATLIEAELGHSIEIDLSDPAASPGMMKIQREANRRLDAALKVARNGFLEFDSDGNVVDMNDTVWKALSGSNSTIENFWDLRRFILDASGRPLPPDHSPVADAVMRGVHLKNAIFGIRLDPEVFKPGRPSDVTDSDDDQIRWLNVNTAPLIVDGDTHTIMSVQDVTAPRMLEREFARQHRRYELIFEYASDVLAVIDRSGRLLFSSPSAERVMGAPLDDRTPGGLLALIHPDDRNVARQMFVKVLSNAWDTDERIVIRASSTTGEWVYLEVTATNLLLEPSINGILMTARDVSSREMLTQALAHQALRDPLTGIFNRRAFSDGLERSLARAARSDGNVGLLWLDLDGFKMINDEYGHAVGDAVLVEVARRLTSTIRTGDIAGRFGGDEFVVALEPIRSSDDAVAMAERLLKSVMMPVVVDGLELTCSVSIGIAISDGETDQDALLARSDTAMYEAKRSGGQRIGIG